MARRFSMVLVGVLALAAVACGHAPQDAVVDVDTNFDAHALAASVDHTTQAATAKVHLTMTATSTGSGTAKGFGGGAVTMTGDGAYDTSTGMSTMTADLGAALSGTTEVVQHGDVVYMRMPTLSAMIPSLAGKWLKIDGSKFAALAGRSSAGPLGGSNGVGDPSAILDYLRGAGADVTTVGHEDVGGVDTTHVHATVSVQQALDASGADRDKVERSLDQLPDMGQSLGSLSFPVDVYVDADGYVRRVALAFDTTGAAAMSMTMTLDYSDFGAPVSVTEPAATDTADICDLYAAMPMRPRTGSTLPAGVC